MSTGSRPKVPGNLGLVAFDVDGVLTDGRIWLSDDGVETKAFNTQDGFGIRQLLRAGLEVAVISGRQSNAVEKRMSELGVTHVILGCGDKVAAFQSLIKELGIESMNTARRPGNCCRKCSCRSESGMCFDDNGIGRARRRARSL